MLLDKITKLGPYFLAIPMVVFGIQHFIYAEFVVALVPTWIPGPLFWTYFAGVALFAAGTGIAFNIQSRLAATLLGLMIFSWIIILHIPRVFAFPGDGEFINVFDAFMMCGGAFILANSLPGPSYLEKVRILGGKAAPLMIAISLAVFGVKHFIHGKLVFIVGADYYEFPAAPFLVYFSGLVFIAAVAGILFSKKSRAVAAGLGIFILVLTILFYAPQIASNIYWGHAWATFLKGVAMSGCSFILSNSIKKEETYGILNQSLSANTK